MRRVAFAFAVLVAVMSLQWEAGAQSLSRSLFGRYLESLREQAGIPALSALILQDGIEVWQSNNGRTDIDFPVVPTADTPYPIGALSQVIGSTLLLRTCLDESHATLDDQVIRWNPDFPELPTTLRDLLSHTAPGGLFTYSPARFSALTDVVEQCTATPYARLVADRILGPLGMVDTVPDVTVGTPTPPVPNTPTRFTALETERYAGVVRRMAVGYRVDARGRATRTDVVHPSASMATGLVTTARDLARFDAALSLDFLLPETRAAAWASTVLPGHVLPTGLGWFVQAHNAQPVVWQFGVIENAYSSMIIKVPSRGLTVILLANSDGLVAPFGLERGDITTSPFARLVLGLLVP